MAIAFSVEPIAQFDRVCLFISIVILWIGLVNCEYERFEFIYSICLRMNNRAFYRSIWNTAGFRLMLPVLTVAGFGVGYLIAMLITSALHLEQASGCIAFIAGVGAALFAAFAGDRVLKLIWPSGRTLTLSPANLKFRDSRKHQEITIDWAEPTTVMAWRFAVPRGSARVPKGWIMLGILVSQDEAQLPLYTFMSADNAAALPSYANFAQLIGRAAVEKGDLSIREAADQRRLLKAEDERWQRGSEVRREDFSMLVDTLFKYAVPPQKRA